METNNITVNKSRVIILRKWKLHLPCTVKRWVIWSEPWRFSTKQV